MAKIVKYTRNALLLVLISSVYSSIYRFIIKIDLVNSGVIFQSWLLLFNSPGVAESTSDCAEACSHR